MQVTTQKKPWTDEELMALDPEEQIVLDYHSPQPDAILRVGQELSGEEVVPGFSMPVAELFAEFDF